MHGMLDTPLQQPESVGYRPTVIIISLQHRLGGSKTGVEEDVGPGDVMVIPAGVAHERYAAAA